MMPKQKHIDAFINYFKQKQSRGVSFCRRENVVNYFRNKRNFRRSVIDKTISHLVNIGFIKVGTICAKTYYFTTGATNETEKIPE